MKNHLTNYAWIMITAFCITVPNASAGRMSPQEKFDRSLMSWCGYGNEDNWSTPEVLLEKDTSCNALNASLALPDSGLNAILSPIFIGYLWLNAHIQ